MNLAYWYYSDNDIIEAIEFYGFWPLRRISYALFPGFCSRHNSERDYSWIKELEEGDLDDTTE